MSPINKHVSSSPAQRIPGRLHSQAGGIMAILIIPLILIGGGIYLAYYLYKTSPKSDRTPPAPQARLVDVITVQRQDVPTTINAMGTVIPAREVILKPQVSGRIIQINPELIPGGLFQAGQLLMTIDPADYELMVKQRQTEVAQAESNLKIELGNQAVAQQEFELLGEHVHEADKTLVLREPQLLSVQSRLEATRAQLEQAKLDLERTRISAPFNAIVNEKYVDIGTTVSPSSSLATLTGTDEYWIEALVPVDQLQWIIIPRQNGDQGSHARIYNTSGWADDEYREGQVIRLSGELETNGRMARLLISINDPLALNTENTGDQPLLIGSYVRTEIAGQTIPSVVRLDRYLLRDGDNVWVCTPENTLEIRPVKVVFRSENNVLITKGLESGDRVIITDMAAVVNTMPVRLPGPPEKTDQNQPTQANNKDTP
ncbi:MAG: efflux RND transporter periplasmic adaptor subunit [Sedimentisphaerales bacterium]|nr:efflux RND transporter periplasmic adaptor subunit [Sedimentisphaerales bacterium]